MPNVRRSSPVIQAAARKRKLREFRAALLFGLASSILVALLIYILNLHQHTVNRQQ